MTEIHDYTFYTFICNDPNIKDCYVGSTRSFRQRKRSHKYNCLREQSDRHNLKVYETIRANGGWQAWKMIPIDSKTCTNLEARIYENKLMEERGATMNIHNAYTSDEDQKINRKESYNNFISRNVDYHKHYRINNAEKIKLVRQQYYQLNKDKIIAQQKLRREKLKLEEEQNEILNQHT